MQPVVETGFLEDEQQVRMHQMAAKMGDQGSDERRGTQKRGDSTVLGSAMQTLVRVGVSDLGWTEFRTMVDVMVSD